MGSSSVWRRGAAILECRFKKPLRSDDMTKIAAVILVGNAAEAERQARIALGKGADLVELRLDEIVDLGPKTIRHLAKSLGEHAIATNRSPGQGGAQRRGGAPRSALMKEICGQRFAYVDVELEEGGAGPHVPAPAAHDHRTRVLLYPPLPQAVGVHRASPALEALS